MTHKRKSVSLTANLQIPFFPFSRLVFATRAEFGRVDPVRVIRSPSRPPFRQLDEALAHVCAQRGSLFAAVTWSPRSDVVGDVRIAEIYTAAAERKTTAEGQTVHISMCS
ncbi:hypothetical protein L596_009439 [Steinernema carpocapsae]|uniref:Uncharacterized protein n=1 Tax=Steinernema carpocapsae TaxID=34508 RepID=A0A4U5PFC6_STECR|nr:hypothetical protein L596_009439 [Steinernema carpocapsae]